MEFSVLTDPSNVIITIKFRKLKMTLCMFVAALEISKKKTPRNFIFGISKWTSRTKTERKREKESATEASQLFYDFFHTQNLTYIYDVRLQMYIYSICI